MKASSVRHSSRGWIATAVTLSVLLAYMPFLSRAGAESDAVSGSRVTELLFLGAAAAGGIALRGRNHRRPLPVPAFLLLAVVSVFSLWAMITSLTGPLVSTGIIKAIELLTICGIGRELSLSTQTSGKARRSRIATMLLLGIVVTVFVLLVSNVLQTHELLPMENVDDWPATDGRPRLLLGTNHPLSSALLLAFGVIICLNAHGSFIWRLPTLIGLAWLLHLCDARGIETGCAVGVAIFLFQKAPRSPFKLLFVSLVVIAIVFMAGSPLLSGDISQTISHNVGKDAWTLNSRIPLWSYMLARVPNHSIMGVGYYSTRNYILDAFPFAGHAHNSALEVLFSTGLIGELFFILFVGGWIFALVATRDPLLASVSPIVVFEGSLDPILFTPGVGMFVMLVILLNALSRTDKQTVRPRQLRGVNFQLFRSSHDDVGAYVIDSPSLSGHPRSET